MTRSSTGEYTAPYSTPAAVAQAAKSAAPPPSAFDWHSWPLIDEWRRCAPVAAMSLIVAVAIGLALGSLDLALLTFAVQAVVLWRLWLPIRYEINSHGIEQRILGQGRLMPWPAIRRYELRRDGVVIFRNADERPFDSWRGLYVPWSRHHTAVLMALNIQLSPADAAKVN